MIFPTINFYFIRPKECSTCYNMIYLGLILLLQIGGITANTCGPTSFRILNLYLIANMNEIRLLLMAMDFQFCFVC